MNRRVFTSIAAFALAFSPVNTMAQPSVEPTAIIPVDASAAVWTDDSRQMLTVYLEGLRQVSDVTLEDRPSAEGDIESKESDHLSEDDSSFLLRSIEQGAIVGPSAFYYRAPNEYLFAIRVDLEPDEASKFASALARALSLGMQFDFSQLPHGRSGPFSRDWVVIGNSEGLRAVEDLVIDEHAESIQDNLAFQTIRTNIPQAELGDIQFHLDSSESRRHVVQLVRKLVPLNGRVSADYLAYARLATAFGLSRLDAVGGQVRLDLHDSAHQAAFAYVEAFALQKLPLLEEVVRSRPLESHDFDGIPEQLPKFRSVGMLSIDSTINNASTEEIIGLGWSSSKQEVPLDLQRCFKGIVVGSVQDGLQVSDLGERPFVAINLSRDLVDSEAMAIARAILGGYISREIVDDSVALLDSITSDTSSGHMQLFPAEDFPELAAKEYLLQNRFDGIMRAAVEELHFLKFQRPPTERWLSEKTALEIIAFTERKASEILEVLNQPHMMVSIRGQWIGVLGEVNEHTDEAGSHGAAQVRSLEVAVRQLNDRSPMNNAPSAVLAWWGSENRTILPGSVGLHELLLDICRVDPIGEYSSPSSLQSRESRLGDSPDATTLLISAAKTNGMEFRLITRFDERIRGVQDE